MGRKRKTNHNLPPRVYLKFGAYHFVHHDGRWEKLARVGEEKLMRQKWALLADPDNSQSNTAALINDYLANFAVTKAPRTYKDNLVEAEYLKIFFGQMQPQDILPRHVGNYLDINRKSRGVRANREKALLSHVFTWAMRHPLWGTMVTSNPCRGVHRNPETKRVRIVQDWEFQGVYKLAHRNVQKLMDLQYKTLQRPGDLLKIGPRNVFTKEVNGKACKVLTLFQNKGNERVQMEIIVTDDLEKVIAPASNVIYPTFIHTENGKQYTYSGIRSMFTRALEKWRDQVEKETGQRPKPWGIYDLKGKGATDMYKAGVPIEQISELCGHDSITTTEIYIKDHTLDPVMPNQREIAR